MTPDRHARIKEIFLTLCKLAPEERDRRISDACGGDEHIRREVTRLLNRHLPLDEDRSGDGSPANAGPAASSGGGGTGQESDLPEFQPGTIVAGRYRIITMLGEGGIGRVYSAEDTRLGITVALKFLPRFHAYDPTLRSRVEDEVRLARQISHPNICRIHDLGEADGLTFISMEYIQGEDLGSLLRRVGRLTGERAVEIARQICVGLSAAHIRGVIHRDLKPGNIMLDNDGRVVITDFGLALLKTDVNPDEVLAGTPRYMAPEQLAAGLVSEKSDIYSLGLVLYEMFTGRPAFRADRVLDYVRLHRFEEPEAPSNVVVGIDPDVESVILLCLRKNPAERPESALVVAAWLPGGDILSAALAAGEVPTREMVADSVSRSGNRRESVYLLAAAFVLLLGTAVALGLNTHPVARGEAVKAPEVLMDRARQVLAAAGLKMEPVDSAGRFISAREIDAQLADCSSNARNRMLAVGPEIELMYAYQAYYVAPIWRSRQVIPPLTMQQDPVRLTMDPQSALVVLDSVGHLLYLDSDLTWEGESGGRTANIDWATLIGATDVELVGTGTAPMRILAESRTGAANEFKATSRREPNRPMRVDVRSDANRVIFLAVLDAKPLAREASYESAAERRGLVGAIRNSVFVVLLAAAVPLAIRNANRRGDVAGAVRLGVFVCIVRLAGNVLSVRHLGAFSDEIQSISISMISALCEGLIMALFYLAIEHYVRRIWPRTLGGWSRILAARFYDPYVGRDVLIGCVVGAYLATLWFLDRRIPIWCGWSSHDHLRLADSLQALLGGRFAVAAVCALVLDGMYQSLLLLLLLVVSVSLLGRRHRLAGIIVWLIAAPMYAPTASHPVTGWTLFAIGGVAVAIVVLIRWGLLTLFAAMVTLALLGLFPIGDDLRAWYTGYGIFAVLATLGLGIWGVAGALRPIDSGRRFSRPPGA